MTPKQRWERIHALFEQARELPEAQRTRFLEEHCAGDAAVRDEILAMLSAEARAVPWMSRMEQVVADAIDERLAAGPERRFGPYRVLRELGRGGMGTVYLAVRDDGQFEQRVAVKLLRTSLLAPDASRRFLTERRILSRLEHSGIARLYDGSVTDADEPYFIMEYVDGRPLAEHARDLPLDARLRLFLEVCDAVEYAHRHLVVHRDLKPSNIMVDAQGAAKLLDFGIAKVLEDERPENATLTEFRLLTPEYAAPEQVRGEGVTTLTDVYGLGGILYTLLTGKKPVELRDRSWEEIEKAVLHTQIPLASSAVSDPRRRRALAGDLDTICAQALHQDPARRYVSAAALGADVRRYLEGLPVTARRDSLFYRGGKFVRRHRFGAAAAAAVAALTIAFATALVVQNRRIVRERDTTAQVSKLFIDLFRVADPAEARGASITAREILDRGAETVRAGLRGQPEVQAPLFDVLGQVYQGLGLYDKAEPLLAESHRLEIGLAGHGSAEDAAGLHQLGVLRINQGRYPDAIALLEKASELRRRLLGPAAETAQTLTYLGLARSRKGDAAAETTFQEAVAMLRRVHPQGHADLADGLTGLAIVNYSKGDYSRAQALFSEALALRRRLSGNDHPSVADTLNNLASTLSRLGKDQEALAAMREALAVLRQTRGDSHPRVATGLNNLALVLFNRGEYAEAEKLYRESIEIRRQRLGPAHPDLAQSLSNLGLLLQTRGRFEDARTLYDEALAIRREAFGASHPMVVQSLNNTGQLLQLQGRLAEAEAKLRESLRMARMIHGDENPATAISLNNLAGVLADRNRPEAESLYREALAVRRKVLPAGHPHVAYTLVGLGEYLLRHGKAGEAEPLLKEAVTIRRAALPKGHWEIAEAESAWGEGLARTGRSAEGSALLREAAATLSGTSTAPPTVVRKGVLRANRLKQ